MASPQKVVTISWSPPLLPPQAGLNLNLGSHQSDEHCSQVDSCASLGSIVQPRPSPRLAWGMNPPTGSSCPLACGGISSQWFGACTMVTREVITHHLHNPSKWAPKKCSGKLWAEIQDTEAD
jgi:hypothetical protein